MLEVSTHIVTCVCVCVFILHVNVCNDPEMSNVIEKICQAQEKITI